jgi:hypothetical protein
MKLNEIEEELKLGIVEPERAAQLRSILAGEYSYTAGLLESIAGSKPSKWLALRKESKTDKSTDREWEATTDGITEAQMKLRLKRLEKLIGAAKSFIELAEGQKRHNY